MPWTGLYEIRLSALMPAFTVYSPNPGIENNDNYDTDVVNRVDVGYDRIPGACLQVLIALHNIDYGAFCCAGSHNVLYT